ncbi:hypothetical protein [Thermosinus carboxydivorans]|uniref:hypothetical protein n=1 Tax=Thermosinus carboxydivorans TaxID=261685 RepID=UPI0002EFAD76|nr:hypothetical protein [Thermosinus carboxydivorans]
MTALERRYAMECCDQIEARLRALIEVLRYAETPQEAAAGSMARAAQALIEGISQQLILSDTDEK